MPSTVVSPGVYSNEIDLSLYSQQISQSILGLVGVTTKGPVNEKKFITNESDLVDVFGRPSVNAYAFYTAREYLRQGNQLWMVRVGTSALAYGSCKIKDNLIGGTDSIQFNAISQGTWSNFLRITTQVASGSGVKILVEELISGQYFVREVFDNITRANVVSVINGASVYVTATVLTAGSPGEPVTGQAVAMTGGNDGITGAPGELNSAVSGSIIAGNPTGLKIFEDSEQLDINLLSAPGFSDGAIINEVIRICEARHDSLGLVDPPALLTPTEVVDFHNGTGIWTGLHAAFNSSFGALFYDWLKVNDEYNATQLYIPPSGHASACIARTDRETQPWFAPAGMRRGRASTALAVGHSPNQGQRDLMMGGTNRVNPFVNFAREGINLFGQMTLQRFASSLDRINVRRLLNTIEKTVATSSRVFLFEPNDRVTWRQWKGVVDPVLRDIVARRGLIEYALIMDESTTTPLSIDRGEMHGKIYLKPVKAAEKIILDFIVTSQGATFNELVVAA